MSFFDFVNPFSYITPVYADDEEVENAPVVAADAVEAVVEVVEQVEASNAEGSDDEEAEETEEEEEEEEEEPEDQAPFIKEACGETMACKSLKHHLDECAARVEEGSKESCAEELLHFLHCVDNCAADRIFAKLKALRPFVHAPRPGSYSAGLWSLRQPSKPLQSPALAAARAGYRSLSRWHGRPHPAIAGMARPSLANSTSRRFLAAAAMRYYVPGGPLRKLAGGKVLMTMLGSVFHILRASLRLPVMILTSAIASLAYIEYKLSQMSAPGWVTGNLEKMRGWLEGIRDSDWLRSTSSDTSSDDKENEHVDTIQGSRGGWGGGMGSPDSGSDPQSDGGGIPPPKGDYYTSPDSGSLDDDYAEPQRPVPSASSANRESSSDDNALMELTKKLLEIQSILKTVSDDGDGGRSSNALQLPSIVVIGSQSSGKSSVLEAIVGQEFLPKGTNMVTRRPVELTLINTPDAAEEYGEFPQLGLDRIRDFSRIQRTLYDLNMSVPETECVSDKPIELRIYSPHVPDLRLVDLPGYIQVVNRKQPPVLKQKIRDLCETYLKQPNIILAVCAADVDLANSEALRASRRNDPLGMRTIGVITKVDTAEPDAAVHMLTQNDYPLHLGYIGVVCKPVREKAGITSHEVVLSEAQYFKKHAEFQQAGVQIGVGTLRRKLVRVLEESMRQSLSTLVDAVRSELEETRYQIKVQYNDERVSPESYMAESLDVLKQRFKAFQQQFGKPQLRAEVQRWLESQVMNVCAELYWSDPAVRGLSTHVTRSRAAGWWADVSSRISQAASATASVMNELLAANTAKEQKGPRLSKPADAGKDAADEQGRSKNGSAAGEWSESDDVYWGHQLDRASALLTKSGVGRWTTQMVVDLLMENVVSMVDAEPFVHHPETRTAVLNFSHAILRNKYHSTVDQVENTIKPFKYEVEIEPHEWNKARKRSATLIDNEIRLCRQALLKIRSSTPKRQLQHAVQFVKSTEKRGLDPLSVQAEITRRHAEQSTEPDSAAAEPEGSAAAPSEAAHSDVDELGYAQYSPRLLRQAQQVLMVQDRLAILHLRRKALASSTCASPDNKRFCPETFLDVVAEKLAYNAVLFINYELLQDFFFQFPRELDSNLYYGKTLQQTREFASQNPHIGQQLKLLERRQRLEVVMGRLNDLVRQQAATEHRGRGRGRRSSNSSPSHRNPFPGL
ncbi:mitochondrial dynamin GTPase Msp1 [Coemansia sp. RSA 2705]|nr:mitochondrial dynamin GTPase Msp1 [Coemansia sp. RSA 2705]